MNVRTACRLNVALCMVVAALSGGGAAPSKAADPGGAVPPQVQAKLQQLESKIEKFQQYLQELRQERQSRKVLPRLRDELGSIGELDEICDNLKDKLDAFLQDLGLKEKLQDLLDEAGGQIGLGNNGGAGDL